MFTAAVSHALGRARRHSLRHCLRPWAEVCQRGAGLRGAVQSSRHRGSRLGLPSLSHFCLPLSVLLILKLQGHRPYCPSTPRPPEPWPLHLRSRRQDRSSPSAAASPSLCAAVLRPQPWPVPLHASRPRQLVSHTTCPGLPGPFRRQLRAPLWTRPSSTNPHSARPSQEFPVPSPGCFQAAAG